MSPTTLVGFITCRCCGRDSTLLAVHLQFRQLREQDKPDHVKQFNGAEAVVAYPKMVAPNGWDEDLCPGCRCHPNDYPCEDPTRGLQEGRNEP